MKEKKQISHFAEQDLTEVYIHLKLRTKYYLKIICYALKIAKLNLKRNLVATFA